MLFMKTKSYLNTLHNILSLYVHGNENSSVTYTVSYKKIAGQTTC